MSRNLTDHHSVKTVETEAEVVPPFPLPPFPYKIRPSVRSLFPGIIAGLGIGLISIWGVRNIEGSELVILPLVPLLLAVILARPVIHLIDCRLIVTEHHIHFHHGSLSLRRKQVDFPYEDILGVEIDQTVLDRILGIGTIAIGTAVRSRGEVCMPSVRNPEKQVAIIGHLIDRARVRERAHRRS